MKKTAIYYYDVGNTFRPNQDELKSKMYCCPRCRGQMFKPRNQAFNPVFRCPNCGFEILADKVLEESQIDEAIEKKKLRKIYGDETIVKDILDTQK